MRKKPVDPGIDRPKLARCARGTGQPNKGGLAIPRVEVDKAACTGCGVCVETCPTDVLRLERQNLAYMAYAEDCQGCFICQWDCAYEAIRVRIR